MRQQAEDAQFYDLDERSVANITGEVVALVASASQPYNITTFAKELQDLANINIQDMGFHTSEEFVNAFPGTLTLYTTKGQLCVRLFSQAVESQVSSLIQQTR